MKSINLTNTTLTEKMAECLMSWPVIVTLVYCIFCLSVGFLVPQCGSIGDSDDCGENTVLGWSVDFFIALIAAVTTIHLALKTKHKINAILAFGGTCLGFLFKGFAARYYVSSGADDGRAITGFFINTVFQYILWTVSTVFFAFLVETSWSKLREVGRTCGLLEAKLAVVVNVASAIVVVTGCVWNGLSSRNMVDKTGDEYTQVEPSNQKWPQVEVFRIGELTWHGSCSLFLVAAAYVWRAHAKEHPAKFVGIPNHVAACGILISQMILLSFVVYFAVNDEVWALGEVKIAANVSIGYFMMLSILLTHNLIYTLHRDDNISHREGLKKNPKLEDSQKKNSFVNFFFSVLAKTMKFQIGKSNLDDGEETDEMDSSEEGSDYSMTDQVLENVENGLNESNIFRPKTTDGFSFFMIQRLRREKHLIEGIQDEIKERMTDSVSLDEEKTSKSFEELRGPGGKIIIRCIDALDNNNSCEKGEVHDLGIITNDEEENKSFGSQCSKLEPKVHSLVDSHQDVEAIDSMDGIEVPLGDAEAMRSIDKKKRRQQKRHRNSNVKAKLGKVLKAQASKITTKSLHTEAMNTLPSGLGEGLSTDREARSQPDFGHTTEKTHPTLKANGKRSKRKLLQFTKLLSNRNSKQNGQGLALLNLQKDRSSAHTPTSHYNDVKDMDETDFSLNAILDKCDYTSELDQDIRNSLRQMKRTVLPSQAKNSLTQVLQTNTETDINEVINNIVKIPGIQKELANLSQLFQRTGANRQEDFVQPSPPTLTRKQKLTALHRQQVRRKNEQTPTGLHRGHSHLKIKQKPTALNRGNAWLKEVYSISESEDDWSESGDDTETEEGHSWTSSKLQSNTSLSGGRSGDSTDDDTAEPGDSRNDFFQVWNPFLTEADSSSESSSTEGSWDDSLAQHYNQPIDDDQLTDEEEELNDDESLTDEDGYYYYYDEDQVDEDEDCSGSLGDSSKLEPAGIKSLLKKSEALNLTKLAAKTTSSSKVEYC
jgi:hypothetical protein